MGRKGVCALGMRSSGRSARVECRAGARAACCTPTSSTSARTEGEHTQEQRRREPHPDAGQPEAIEDPKPHREYGAAAWRIRVNVALMLVTVVTVFIVCQLPNLGIRIALTAGEFAPPGTLRLDIAALRYANDASNALLTLNSAVNFAVYCLVGKKFRRRYKCVKSKLFHLT